MQKRIRQILLNIFQIELCFPDILDRAAVIVDICSGTHGTLQVANIGEFPVYDVFSISGKHKGIFTLCSLCICFSWRAVGLWRRFAFRMLQSYMFDDFFDDIAIIDRLHPLSLEGMLRLDCSCA